MSEKLLLDRLKNFDGSKTKAKPRLIIRFSDETNAVDTEKNDAIYDGHTGSNSGGSSTPSCKRPDIF